MNNRYQLTQESTLDEAFKERIEPFWQSQVQTEILVADDGVKLFTAFSIPPNAKASIVFLAGRSEGAVKYKEFLYNLYQNGVAFFTLDHRGQGQSDRMTENPEKGHVETYNDYVADLYQFYQKIVEPKQPHESVMVCHSMGCAIGANFNLQHPKCFDKAVYCSPMFGISAPIPVWLAKGILSVDLLFNRFFSKQPWYFIGQGNHTPEEFIGNHITQSEVRFDLGNSELDKLDAQIGGITSQWLSASIKAMSAVIDNASLHQQDTLILQAGADTVVDNNIQNKVCRNMPRCAIETIPDAKHELLMERDNYRNPSIEHILNFTFK